MVSVPPEFVPALNYISSLFQIRPEWLLWPNVLTVFLVPLVLNTVMFYILLHKILKIFPSSGVNMVLGAIIALLMLPLNSYTAIFAPFIIGFFGIGGGGLARSTVKLFVIGFLYALYFFILPWLTSGSFYSQIANIRLP